MYKPSIDKTLKDLKQHHAQVLHGVDATKLNEHLEVGMKFDRIVWNFPHAGFPDVDKNEHKGPGFEWADEFHERHVAIIEGFFKGIQELSILEEETGRVVMTHKTIEPFSLWDIPAIAQRNNFDLETTHPFSIN